MPMDRIEQKMRRIYALIFFTMYFVCSIVFNEVYAATITASSCSSANVQAAINAASRGDTVFVPRGKCTWSNEVTIDKALKIQGAGFDLTTITSDLPIPSGTYSGYWLFKYTPSSPSSDANEIFEISGFTFDNAFKAGSIAVRNLSATAINKVKIHNNKFLRCWGGEKASTDYTNTIMIEGTVYGVVYSNSFSGFPHIDNYGYTASSGGLETWNGVKWEPGTSKAMYYEDNLFEKNVSGDSTHLIFSGDKGTTYVSRYNTFVNSYNQMELWNMHSIQRGGTPDKPTWVTYATMGVEAYGNKATNTVSDTFLWIQGGGRLIAFYNYIDNGFGGSAKYVVSNPHAEKYAPTNHKCNDSTNYACSSDGESQIVRKSYYFNNRKSYDGGLISLLEIRYPSWDQWGGNQLQENINYFRDNSNCTASSCLSGVGCGSTTPTGVCTTGVGYWKTDQPCSSLTAGSYGANPSTPISGTLYRCTSTNKWSVYYKPYTYPHPLRSSDPNTETISPPKGFKLVN